MDPIIAVDRTTHQLRKVSDVENGMKCNCICSECGEAHHHGRDRQSVVEVAEQQRIVAKIEELFEQINRLSETK